MACFLRETLRKPFLFRFISTHAHKRPNIIPPTLSSLHSPHFSRTGLDQDQNLDWNWGLTPGKELVPDTRLHVYPSFSLEYFLNPNPLSGLDRSAPVDEPAGDESDDPGKLWADSVKKKRKKKMNKHKYKKLRKRLRRKT